MKTYSNVKSIEFEEYDFEEDYDDEDFFSDDLSNYTDTMRDFKDK